MKQKNRVNRAYILADTRNTLCSTPRGIVKSIITFFLLEIKLIDRKGIFLMERNYISEVLDTHFYINMEEQIYGICINVKDLYRADEIIKYIKEDRKEQIEAWRARWNKVEVCV